MIKVHTRSFCDQFLKKTLELIMKSESIDLYWQALTHISILAKCSKTQIILT